MRLRTTEEFDTLAYATSPINFGGLEKEDLLIWLVPMAITNNISDDGLLSFAVGCTVLWFYKKMTGDQPSGHLGLRVSLLVGEWQKSDIAARHPVLKKVLTGLNKILTSLWIDKGLIPSPNYCNRYEP